MTISPYAQYKTVNRNCYVVAVAMPLFVFAAGTGGYSNAHCFAPYRTKVHGEVPEGATVVAKANPNGDEAFVVATHAEDLKLVRDYVKPSVAQLAAALGVERQTIYDWQAGRGVSDERREMIRELASACSRLAEAGIMAGDDILRRKISNGQTLLQLIASGIPVGEAVSLVKSILKTEQHERRLLAEHLKRRPNDRIDTTDAGKPHLSEEG